jgi:hypothetical protein
MRRLALIIAVILSVAGCGGNATPTSPTALLPVSLPNISAAVSPIGNWSGAINDTLAGEGTLQMSISDPVSPEVWSGTWSAAFRNAGSFSGLAVATMSSTTSLITLRVEPQPQCQTASGPGASVHGFILTNLAPTSNRLSAALSRISCNAFGIGSGSVSLSKQ